MASVAMATLSSTHSAARSSSASSNSSSLPRQASLQFPCSRATFKEVTTPPCLSYGLASIQFVLSHNGCERFVTHAAAEALTEEPSVIAEEGAGASIIELSKLKLESDLLKKKAKRAELRRKRLVRKRHLRKKGRWPPSKMAKLKNV